MSGETHLEEAHNVADVVFKAEVDHAVRLIHAEILAVGEREALLFQHIDEPPGCRDDDMKPFVQYVALLAHGYTTDTKQGAQKRVLGVFCDGSRPREHVFVRLCGEFARGTEDDANRAFAANKGKTDLFLEGEHDEGETEREGFPGACECDPDHVSTGEAERYEYARQG